VIPDNLANHSLSNVPMRASQWLGAVMFAACNAPPPPSTAAAAPPAHVTAAASARSELEAAFGFEGPSPRRWKMRPEGTIALDSGVVHTGHGAIRIERTAAAAMTFSTIIDGIPIDFAGSTVELRGFLRTEDVRGNAGLWLREDGEGSPVQFSNMHEAKLEGTTPWKEYSIQLPLDRTAKDLAWGVLLEGEGKAWADDLQLLVDGKAIWEAPYLERPSTPIDRDHQFDHGSGIAIDHLTPQQIQNLALAGRVWGFLKYHHPKVTSGQLHWDYELLRVLPAILAASDRATAEAALLRWVDGLGPVAPCRPCATLEERDLAVRPDLAWLDDRAQVGAELGARLHAIYDARTPDQQYYVSFAPGVGNPELLHEPAYPDLRLPDAGFQLLGLFRLWNIVEYWAPDRRLADRWPEALAELIPSVAQASSAKDYQLAMMSAIVRIRDTHANLWSSLAVRPPEGECSLALDLRFVGGRAVVASRDPDGKLAPGDVIASIDGTPIETLLARWMPYYAGSNDASRLRDVASAMTRGSCGDVTLGIERGSSATRLTVKRSRAAPSTLRFHDLPGPAFRLLSPDVAYLKLSAVKADDLAHDVEQAAHTKGWIIDIRNYPSEFVVFALGSLLVDKSTPFARFTAGNLSNPGAFYWGDSLTIEPATPHYGGLVVVLVDEVSQSQAEYTAMALRAAPRTMIIGSTTAGADGNVSEIALPGRFSTMFSGLGVFYPDKSPTQVVGIVPDIVVTPTIAGLRAGRDEVLEAGIHGIVGKTVPAAKIENMARGR
jgi:C-terminal processing protease CtpA/Prc